VTAFVVGVGSPLDCRRTPRWAESNSESENRAASVKLTDENVKTSASVLGGVFGLLVGGVWVGAILFFAASFLARREEDNITKTINDVARTALEAINSVGDLNEQYQVTDQVGSFLSDAVQSAKENPSTKDAATAVTGVIDKAVDYVSNFDKEVDIKGTAGSLIISGSNAAADAVDKLAELAKEYKVTDAVGKKIDEVTKK